MLAQLKCLCEILAGPPEFAESGVVDAQRPVGHGKIRIKRNGALIVRQGCGGAFVVGRPSAKAERSQSFERRRSGLFQRNIKLLHGSQRFTEFVKQSAKKRRDAGEVAQLILRIANDPNPKLRYLIGTDAKIQVWLKRLLPWKSYERMVAKAVKIDV